MPTLRQLPSSGGVNENLQVVYESAQESHMSILSVVKHLEDLMSSLDRVKKLIQGDVMDGMSSVTSKQGRAQEDHNDLRKTQGELLSLLERIERTTDSLREDLMDHRELRGMLEGLEDRMMTERDVEMILEASRKILAYDMDSVTQASKKALGVTEDPWHVKAVSALRNKFWEMVMGAVLITLVKFLGPVIWAQNQPSNPPAQVQTAPSATTPTPAKPTPK